MEKLKLDRKDVKAVKDSIAHWKRDIQTKLKQRVKIEKVKEESVAIWHVRWADDKENVKCFAIDCPLCQMYVRKQCSKCPYVRKYYGKCYILHWRKFIENPCLKTCNGMIKALENILK